MQDRSASAFVQECMTPLEPIYRNPKTHVVVVVEQESLRLGVVLRNWFFVRFFVCFGFRVCFGVSVDGF